MDHQKCIDICMEILDLMEVEDSNIDQTWISRRFRTEVLFQICHCYGEMEEFKLSVHFLDESLWRDPYSWKDNYNGIYIRKLYYHYLENNSDQEDSDQRGNLYSLVDQWLFTASIGTLYEETDIVKAFGETFEGLERVCMI